MNLDRYRNGEEVVFDNIFRQDGIAKESIHFTSAGQADASLAEGEKHNFIEKCGDDFFSGLNYDNKQSIAFDLKGDSKQSISGKTLDRQLDLMGDNFRNFSCRVTDMKGRLVITNKLGDTFNSKLSHVLGEKFIGSAAVQYTLYKTINTVFLKAEVDLNQLKAYYVRNKLGVASDYEDLDANEAVVKALSFHKSTSIDDDISVEELENADGDKDENVSNSELLSFPFLTVLEIIPSDIEMEIATFYKLMYLVEVQRMEEVDFGLMNSITQEEIVKHFKISNKGIILFTGLTHSFKTSLLAHIIALHVSNTKLFVVGEPHGKIYAKLAKLGVDMQEMSANLNGYLEIIQEIVSGTKKIIAVDSIRLLTSLSKENLQSGGITGELKSALTFMNNLALKFNKQVLMIMNPPVKLEASSSRDGRSVDSNLNAIVSIFEAAVTSIVLPSFNVKSKVLRIVYRDRNTGVNPDLIASVNFNTTLEDMVKFRVERSSDSTSGASGSSKPVRWVTEIN